MRVHTCFWLLLSATLSIVPTASAAETPSAISVRDFQGREVNLAQPAQRIVALSPHIVENTFSAGAGDKLVGVVSYSDYPEQARHIERIGNFQSWSLEALIALQPDLVLLWGSGNGIDTLSTFERLGIPVFVSEPRQLKDIPYAIRAIGQLAGTSATSEVEAARIEQALAGLQQKFQREHSVSVFYQIWNEPLQTVNGQHLISQMIELCGGHNVFADAVTLAPRINIESVLGRDPDVIVASGMDTARPEWLDHWRGYTSLKAVRNNALFFIPPDHVQRPTARIVLGARELCDKLATVD
jgi:iron complex transport system substrate-binding protein